MSVAGVSAAWQVHLRNRDPRSRNPASEGVRWFVYGVWSDPEGDEIVSVNETWAAVRDR